MSEICPVDMCAGCGACADICPHQAVTIRQTLRTCRAVVDEARCVQCGLCRTVCPVCNDAQASEPIAWKEGWALEPDLRKRAASGGFATAIALGFVRNGGIVCSCTFDDGSFGFRFADNEQELAEFAGSRYVKSTLSGNYQKLRTLLQEGRELLFIGLPCQAAAVRQFVGKKLWRGLYTVDLICHGTPSVPLLDVYLQAYGKHTDEAKDITFRRKGNFQISVDGVPLVAPGVCDSYMIAFFNGLTYTQNCYECPYASAQRVTDLTLGDSWGSSLLKKNPDGVSLALCQTEKGSRLLQMARLYIQDADPEIVTANNAQLCHPSREPSMREAFLEGLQKGKSFDALAWKYLPRHKLKQFIKSVLIRMKFISR